MPSFLFRIGTLALLFGTLAPGCVPEWNARGEVRDQGRPPAVSRPSIRHRANYCVTCERTPAGRIRRSSTARRTFERLQPCPSTGAETGSCPGYVIDHIVPLKRGGADSPDNMQWQSIEESKAKDRLE